MRNATSCLAVAAAVAAAALLSPRAAEAKEVTAASTIVQVKINEKSDIEHALYHGAIWLEHDKQENTYRWGGKACGNAELSPANLGVLFDAFRARYIVILDYKLHAFKSKRYRCITGFTVSRS